LRLDSRLRVCGGFLGGFDAHSASRPFSLGYGAVKSPADDRLGAEPVAAQAKSRASEAQFGEPDARQQRPSPMDMN